MFERICITPKYPDQQYFDLGLLAECMLFYGEVIVVVRSAQLEALLRQCGLPLFFELLERGYLKIKCLETLLGAISVGENEPQARYDFGLIRSKKIDLEPTANNIFRKLTGGRSKAQRCTNRFLSVAEPISYDPSITKQIIQEMQDGKYIADFLSKYSLEKGVKLHTYDNKSASFRFGTLDIGRGFPLNTNLDFSKLSEIASIKNELHKPSSLLAMYGTTVADLSLWSRFGAEVVANPINALILQARFEPMLVRSQHNKEQIESFQKFTLTEAGDIRECINSGQRSFKDMLPLLDKAAKFSEWLRAQKQDADLVQEYYKKVTEQSWINKLPNKVMRWVLFSSIGLSIDFLAGTGGIGTSIGLAISAFDTFLLERLMSGWKPNQFIEGPLLTFINNS
jgi:hypothetical protein